MKTRNLQLTFAITIYLLGTFVLAFVSYTEIHKHLIKEVDDKLYMAAYSTALQLGDKFHSQTMGPNTISAEKDYEIALELTDFVRSIGVEYVYSAMIKENDIVFITSSATKTEIENDSYRPAYFTKYVEANEELRRVFTTQEVAYSEYQDRWGAHRSVFIPLISGDGSLYVVGADISLAEVQALSQQSAIAALFACLGLGLIGLPLLYLFTKSIKRESQLETAHLYRCPLTGLPNRNQLIEDLTSAACPSIAIINIDKFGEIANVYGPAIGDDILKQFSLRLGRIKGISVSNIQIYRLNADEFALLTTGQHPIELLRNEVKELHSYITARPYQAGSEQINLIVRIGAAGNNEDAYTLADMALRETKLSNKSVIIYENELQLPAAYKKSLEQTQQLKLALDQKRLVPYFQPILNTATGNIEKYECLARMVDDSGRVIGLPDDFIPVAYRSRLYHQFSQLMLDKNLDCIRANQHVLSINLSISDIDHPPTRQFIYDRLSSFMMCHLIEFEIMENQNIEDLEVVKNFIRRVKAYGCHVGLDDLGKDYSNIDRLLKLPVDFVKIDGSIILALATDKDAQDVAKTIIRFARKRRLKVVAEFCSNSTVTEMARQLGVDYLQGYYIGKPSPEFTGSLYQKPNTPTAVAS